MIDLILINYLASFNFEQIDLDLYLLILNFFLTNFYSVLIFQYFPDLIHLILKEGFIKTKSLASVYY